MAGGSDRQNEIPSPNSFEEIILRHIGTLKLTNDHGYLEDPFEVHQTCQ
jgi:hypothetical protein